MNEIIYVMVERYALFFSQLLLGRIPLEIATFGYLGAFLVLFNQKRLPFLVWAVQQLLDLNGMLKTN